MSPQMKTGLALTVILAVALSLGAQEKKEPPKRPFPVEQGKSRKLTKEESAVIWDELKRTMDDPDGAEFLYGDMVGDALDNGSDMYRLDIRAKGAFGAKEKQHWTGWANRKTGKTTRWMRDPTNTLGRKFYLPPKD